MERLATASSDMLVMHESPAATVKSDEPDAVDIELLGRPSVRAVLERSQPTLVICGHAYWRIPLATLSNGTQVFNVDSRVVILQSAKSGIEQNEFVGLAVDNQGGPCDTGW